MPKNVHQNRRSIVVYFTIAALTSAFSSAVTGVVTGATVFFTVVFAVGAASTVGVGVVVVVVFGGRAAFLLEAWRARRDVASGSRRSRVFSSAGRLLPADVRDEYCEEWAAWMADLRADGTPRTRRWLELLSLVLIAVPRLAIGLRMAALRRAVDR